MGKRNPVKDWFYWTLLTTLLLAVSLGITTIFRLSPLSLDGIALLFFSGLTIWLSFLFHGLHNTWIVPLTHEPNRPDNLTKVLLWSSPVLVLLLLFSASILSSDNPEYSRLTRWFHVLIFDTVIVGIFNACIRFNFHESEGAYEWRRAKYEPTREESSARRKEAELQLEAKEREDGDEAACSDSDCKRNSCERIRRRIRVRTAITETELHYAKHLDSVLDELPTTEFRSQLHELAKMTVWQPGVPDWTTGEVLRDAKTIESECLKLRHQITRIAERRAVADLYRNHTAVIADPVFDTWLQDFVRTHLGDDLPISSIKENAARCKELIGERAKAARPGKVVREEMEDRGVRAAEQARESLRRKREQDARAEAIRRIPDFEELLPHEQNKAIREMLELIRHEADECPKAK